MANEIKQRDKPEMIRKIFRAKIKSVDKEKFIVNAVVSDDSMDRYKESILATAYEKRLPTYKQHPILLSSHQYDKLICQIGLTENIYIEGNKLHASFKYFVGEGNSEADWGFKLAEKGIAAFSVGFIPHCFQDPPNPGSEEAKTWPTGVRRRYTEVELLEISQVLVPANSNALQNSLKSESNPIVKSMIEQTIKDKDIFAMKDLNSNRVILQKILVKKLEETENEFTYRIKDPELFVPDSFRQKTIKEDKPRVHAIFGKLKEGEVDVMILQSFRFPKEDGWTIEEAGKWAEDHLKENKNLRIGHIRGVIAHEMYPMMGMDAIWDEEKAIANISKWASSDGSGDEDKIDWDKFSKGFAWQGEKKDSLVSYLMPHHDIVEGSMMTNANGVIESMGSLIAPREQSELSDEDRKVIYEHLAKHYKEMGKEAPEMKQYKDIADAWSGCKDYKTFSSLIEKLTSESFIKSIFAEATISLLRDKEAQIETRLSSIILKQTDSLVKKVLILIEAKMKNINPDKIELNLSEYMPMLSAPEEQEEKNKKDSDNVIKKIQQMFPEIGKMSLKEKEKGLDDHMKKILGSIQDVNSSLVVKSK